MKRTLLIMRHAKSSWEDFSLPDSERPLNKRGRHDAPMMGERLKNGGYRCDKIISSPAVRAYRTSQAVAAALDYPEKKILLDETLYMATLEDYLRCIEKVDKQVEHLMLVSHNPGSEELVEHFTGERFEKFPTAAYALLEIEGEWSAIKSATLLKFDYPKSVQ